MNFMKKNFKLIVGIIGAVLISGISVYATGQYYATQINYTRNNETMTVAEALNDLYANMNENPNSSTLIENIDHWNAGISFSPNDYKWFIMTDIQWHASQKIYSTMISQLAISSIQNASYFESGATGRNAGSSSGAARSYIIIPDGSGEDISISIVGADGTCVYGVK